MENLKTLMVERSDGEGEVRDFMMMKLVAVAWSLATGRADVLDGVSDGEGDG